MRTNPSRSSLRPAGFTLIELLIVLVIVGILMAIAIPAYLRYVASSQDADAKTALTVAYKAAVAGDTEVNASKFPIASTVVQDISADEPSAQVARGDCLSSVAIAPVKQVLVDPASTMSQLTLCVKSASGAIWKLTGPLTGTPAITDASTVALSFTGTEITDAVRAQGGQGDGLINDSSTGLWFSATNLITNGGFETNTATWNTDATSIAATITRDTSTSKFGAASGKITATGAGAGSLFYDNQVAGSYTSGDPYTFSIWVKGTGSTVGKSAHLQLAANGGANGFAALGTSSSVALTTSWQRLTVSGTVDYSDRTFLAAYAIVTGAIAGDSFYIDGAQLEKNRIATPYIETNGAAATRGAGRIQAPAALLSTTQGWVAMRVRLEWPSSIAGGYPTSSPVRLWEWSDYANPAGWMGITLTNPGQWLLTRFNTSGGSGGRVDAQAPAVSWSAGGQLTIIAAWTATGIKISVNGAPFTSAAGAFIPTLPQTNFDIGGFAWNYPTEGEFLWFATGKGTLTDADAASINSWGASDPKRASFPTAAQATMAWDGSSASGTLK